MTLDLEQEYRQALENASRRARWVVLTMASASIVVFAAAWNATRFSWIEQRIQLCGYALENRAWDKTAAKPPGGAEQFEQAQRYLDAAALRTEQDVKDRLRNLQQVKVDHVLHVSAPVLGVTFDINDLGLIAGLSFAILLLMCRHSLYAEQRCLLKAVRAPDASYDLLAGTQVFTVPEETWRIWRWAPKALFLLPVIVQVVVLLVDLSTRQLGEAISVWHARMMIGTDFLLLLVNIALTCACLSISKVMDDAWKEARPPKPPSQPGPGPAGSSPPASPGSAQ